LLHYYDEKERCIFCDIIRQERDTGERIISENEHFITLSPYAPASRLKCGYCQSAWLFV